MHILSVSIRNIKGIEALDFEAGALTVLTGDNGTGKSSVLDALRAVFDGGHNPDLIRGYRDGGTKGSVVIHLSDGHTITRTITDKSSYLKVTTKDGATIPSPAKFVEQLAAGFSYDPLAILVADKKQRLAYVLDALPIRFEPEEIAAALNSKQQPEKTFNLDELNDIRARIYDSRRDTNSRLKEIEGTIATLERTLPETTDEEAELRVEELKQKQADLSAELDGIQGRIKLVVQAERNAARAEYEAKLASIAETAMAQEKRQTGSVLASLQTVENELGSAVQIARQAINARQTKQAIAQHTERARILKAESEAFTSQLDGLDKLKREKLDASAIPGVETRDGEIFYNGVPLDHVNTQQQYFLAFQIAALKVGKLGMMICDHAESIVGDNWTEFCEAVRASGFQVIAARAEAGKPLTVEAEQ